MIIIRANLDDLDAGLNGFVNSEEFLQSAIACVGTKLGLGPNSFERQISRGQSTWKPLSREYLKTKKRDGYDLRIWVRTGRTFRALVDNIPTNTGTFNGMNFKATQGSGDVELSIDTLPGNTAEDLDRERPLFVITTNDEEVMADNIEDEIANILVERGFDVE